MAAVRGSRSCPGEGLPGSSDGTLVGVALIGNESTAIHVSGFATDVRPLPGAHSTCYTHLVSTSLAEVARRTDGAAARARSELVRAVRRAAAEGMTQAQIAAEIGRSQPEVSRLLHFHGTTPLARRLRKHTSGVRQIVTDAGGSNLRVFGSVATGQDHDGSDIDLLFTMGTPLSLMQLGALEQQLSELLDAEVDLVPDSVLRPEFRDRALAEAVLL